MHILIVYASNSGSTYLTSTYIRDELSKSAHKVTLMRAAHANPQDIKAADVLLLGTPSWLVNNNEGQMHETMKEFLDKARETVSTDLKNKKMALFGCGDSTYLEFCGGVDNLERIAKQVGADIIHPSLRIDSFYFEQEKNTELVKQWANDLNNKIGVTSIA